MPEPARRAIGLRGRAWVMSHFDPEATAELTLKLYADVAAAQKAA
jgi:hypothetical protein